MADKKARQPKTQIVTPKGIAAYSYFHKPDTGGTYSDNKYKGRLVLPGDTDLSAIEEKVRAHAAAVFPNADLSDLQLPWKSGDDAKQEEFHGKIILSAKSKYAPKVVDAKKKALRKGVFAKAGDEVRFVVSCYAYTKTEKVKEGKKMIDVQVWGVSFQLDVVQIITKNAGGGGLDALDEIDGFDGSEADDFDGDDDGGDDSSGDDSSDF